MLQKRGENQAPEGNAAGLNQQFVVTRTKQCRIGPWSISVGWLLELNAVIYKGTGAPMQEG